MPLSTFDLQNTVRLPSVDQEKNCHWTPKLEHLPIVALCIISVMGGLNMDMMFKMRRVPGMGESTSCESLECLPGGKGANTAIAAYRAGHVRARAKVTLREARRERGVAQSVILKARLEENGVAVSGVSTAKGEKTGTCVVMMGEMTGESRCLSYQGANREWKLREQEPVSSLAGGEKPHLVIAHFGIRREEAEKVLRMAGEQGIDTLLNPSPAFHMASSTFQDLTHLVMNESEVGELNDSEAWKKAAEHFLDHGVKNGGC
ncbi:hypothetical protein PVAG01_07580 [Phlyctema vagabunda]|uniref:Carbohydrate kinase PfkB domain-containing protein n=1 Tax=Phlyctema vagabunda TaxID=108571 RepID=A0ABR4PCU2_9HELO